jgi:hypothetical protein
MNDATLPPLVRLQAASELLDRAGWSGASQERRVKTAVEAHVSAFCEAVMARCSPEVVDAMHENISPPATNSSNGVPWMSMTRRLPVSTKRLRRSVK